MDALDTLNTRMRFLLLVQAVGFFSWQTAGGVAAYAPEAYGLTGPAELTSFIGAVIWAVGLIVYFRDANRAKTVLGRDVLNDDWARHVRRRAAETSFWVLATSVVASMALTVFEVNSALLLKLLTGLSISTFFVATVIYDRQGDGADD